MASEAADAASERFWTAVTAGDCAEIEAALSAGADVNAAPQFLAWPLRRSCKRLELTTLLRSRCCLHAVRA
jgi:hypothetical protein